MAWYISVVSRALVIYLICMPTLSSQTALAPVMVEYLNRLSDLLFVLARKVNHEAGQPEQPW